MLAQENQSFTAEHPRYAALHQSIVSHAVTGETVGIENYTRMVSMAETIDEKLHLLGEANQERFHLKAMYEVADKLSFDVKIGLDDEYWGKVRAAFKERADAGDLDGCYVIQDIVIEPFAVTMYEAISVGVEPFIAERMERIITDEKGHQAEGVEMLKAFYERDPEGAVERIEFANERAAKVLSEWISPNGCKPMCAVCGAVDGICTQEDLPLIGVDMSMVSARFASQYGQTLRAAGLPTNDVTRWVARLA